MTFERCNYMDFNINTARIILAIICIYSIIKLEYKGQETLWINIMFFLLFAIIYMAFMFHPSENNRYGRIIRKIARGISVIICIALLLLIVWAILFDIFGASSLAVTLVVIVTCAVAGIFYYRYRWYRWWMKFLKTFIPKDTLDTLEWDKLEKHFRVYDNETNAVYGLTTADGIFYGNARRWLDEADPDNHAEDIIETIKETLSENGIEANVYSEHIPGSIYILVSALTDYRSMTPEKLMAFRKAFLVTDEMNFSDSYFVKYRGDEGTILYQCSYWSIFIRAIRIEPNKEYYIYPVDDSLSADVNFFIESNINWNVGTHTLISSDEFFEQWQKKPGYSDVDEAVSFFKQAALFYFESIGDEDDENKRISRWDIENAASYLIYYDKKEAMLELLNFNVQCMYWAIRLFKNNLSLFTLYSPDGDA